MSGVRVEGLVKTFEGGVTAVNDVSFEVPDGQLLTLLGPSGCGKTTTLRLLAGFEIPDDGEIAFGDRVVTSSAKSVFAPPEQRQAGMVFQSYAIWPHMTVFENVAYPLSIRSVSRQETRQRVGECLELLGLSGYEDRSATKLSGGQQQRVAIARALVGNPALLLLDEPLSNLDAKLRAQMRVELLQLQKRLKITTVYVTHDQIEAMVLSDNILVMNEGVIRQSGSPRDIFKRPANQFVADFVGFVNFMPGRVTARAGATTLVRLAPDGPVVRVAAGMEVEAGKDVIVASRASGLKFGANGEATESGDLSGTLVSEAYMGDHVEYHIRVNDFALVANVTEQELASSPTGVPRIGDSLSIHFDPSQTIVVPA